MYDGMCGIYLSSCSISLALYMEMSEVAAAGMIIIGVREGRLPPAALGTASRRTAPPVAPPPATPVPPAPTPPFSSHKS